MQTGEERNLNSPTPRIRAKRQLQFRASALSTVVRRRESTSEHESFPLAQPGRAPARWLPVLVLTVQCTYSLLPKCLHAVQHTRRSDRVACYSVLLLCTWYDGLMAPKMLRLKSSSQMQESQHTRHRRRWGLAQAKRLREGYRYSVPSGAQPPGIRS